MACKLGALRLIDEMIETMDQLGDDFHRPLDVLNQSTIGQHFRHIYNFFECLLDQTTQEVVDYALRTRDHQIEQECQYAQQCFQVLKDKLNSIDENQAINVMTDFELEKGYRPIVSSTIGRELMYAYDHAVHHLAIIKIGIDALDKTVNIAPTLGVAASTLRHQHESYE